MTVWTIGHSTRSDDEFLAALRHYRIECVLDVRRFPASRRHPQFNSDHLARALSGAGVAYHWIEALGGRRSARATGAATAWRHPSFHAYAQHIATEEFAGALTELLHISSGLRSAIMCSELLWWRCHRRLIADLLTSLDVPVVHIRSADSSELHRMLPPARMVSGELTYDRLPGINGVQLTLASSE